MYPTAMSMPSAKSAGAVLEPTFGARPELWSRFQAFYDALWSDGHISRQVLELCRLRVAAIHDCTAELDYRTPDLFVSEEAVDALRRGDFTSFDHCEQAALQVAEKTPYQHHQITDDEVRAVEAAYGPAATVALLTAIAFFDVRCRWHLTLSPGR